MNQSELAKRFGVSQASISTWAREGMPSKRWGRRWIFDEAMCRAWAVERLKPIKQTAASPVTSASTPASSGIVAWLFQAFPRCGAEAAAWLAVELGIPIAQAVDLWWNSSTALFAALARELGADPLRLPEPAAPDVSSVAARLAELEAAGWGRSDEEHP